MFFIKAEFSIFLSYFFAYFYAKTWFLGSGYVDPESFVDPDPESQNLADPMDPDPKHCIEQFKTITLSKHSSS